MESLGFSAEARINHKPMECHATVPDIQIGLGFSQSPGLLDVAVLRGPLAETPLQGL